jgi:hypothetical protein
MQANQSKKNIKEDFSQSVFAFEIRKYFFGAYIKNIDVDCFFSIDFYSNKLTHIQYQPFSQA